MAITTAPADGAPVETALPGTSLFWQLHSAGWFSYFLLHYLSSVAHGKPSDYWSVSLTTAAAGFAVTLGLRMLLRPMMVLRPVVFFAAALFPVLFAAGLIGVAYSFALVEWCNKMECRPDGWLGYAAYIGSFAMVSVSWTGLYWGIKTYQQLQHQTRAALAATAMAHQAQLRMLRYQLNPHFLFNTLNAISTLILDRNNDTANRMVTSLSAFLRHSLDADPMQRVTLRQELDALQLYLGIEKLRFAERLGLEIEIEPEAWSALVPGLLLQPLIENAIKYAIAKRIDGGRIGIFARRAGDMLEIAVRDNGPGFERLEGGLPSGRGVGLRNTRERLKVLYGERQRFVARNRPEGGAEIVLALPFEAGGALRD
jgi:signal transduction histidine kinase